MSNLLIHTPDQITGAWLSSVLHEDGLTVTDTRPIGTGQMSQSHRVTYDGGQTVVVKLASDDPTSRATGVGMGAYSREVSFYSELAGRIGGPLPACHLAVYDAADGWFTLVLEDIAGAEQGDQIAGCSVEDAGVAVRALARVHAPVLGDLHVGTTGWLNVGSPLTQTLLTALLPGFLERYDGRVADAHAEVARRFVPVIDAWAGDLRPPMGLVHGDFRLDNLLFAAGDCKVVDWQTVSWGPAMYDVAYFLGGALPAEVRRAHEEALVRAYVDELGVHGVRSLDWDACWAEYRRQTFGGLLMVIAASMVTVRTDRGDDMFMAWFARAAQQVLDLDALSLLPAVDAGRPQALRPAATDDSGRHEPGPEQTWNESWYFDAVSDDGTLGVYVRLGRLPNREVALYTAAIVGPGRPAVMVVDDAAPLPAQDDESQVIDIEGLRATQRCEEPLQRFRVTLAGVGAAHADESEPLRAEPGTPVDVELDLVWETDGVPYQWRPSTRYEIPCRVSGTVRVGDEEIAFAGPGQRDHSWGSRDWWAADWMWSGLHLEDGTRTHTVTTPAAPGMGVGYIQAGGEVLEIATATSTEVVADNGLITSATLVTGPDELALDVEPVAFGALRLVAPDGRVSHFPRAMVRVAAADGRSGVGWMEWNRNQPAGEG
ncbi:hypothetical protein DSM112329_00937 [Paraconexibacter sp. AEG42_29]|uniref:CHK kinase-like domain-containing protein n=1 Tax=Paraconexibacter sp. AEG42_29 TaxID=2997339 RepID=A0AAU7ARA5_9ACTN